MAKIDRTPVPVGSLAEAEELYGFWTVVHHNRYRRTYAYRLPNLNITILELTDAYPKVIDSVTIQVHCKRLEFTRENCPFETLQDDCELLLVDALRNHINQQMELVEYLVDGHGLPDWVHPLLSPPKDTKAFTAQDLTVDEDDHAQDAMYTMPGQVQHEAYQEPPRRIYRERTGGLVLGSDQPLYRTPKGQVAQPDETARPVLGKTALEYGDLHMRIQPAVDEASQPGSSDPTVPPSVIRPQSGCVIRGVAVVPKDQAPEHCHIRPETSAPEQGLATSQAAAAGLATLPQARTCDLGAKLHPPQGPVGGSDARVPEDFPC